jgi:hypothetical protein
MFDFLKPNLDTAPADPTVNNPFMKYIMPTAGQQAAQTPAQQSDVNPETQALINALRGNQQSNPMGAPASAGRIQSTGYFGDGMNTNAIGNVMKPLFGSSTPTAQPWTDANTFGTGDNWSPT